MKTNEELLQQANDEAAAQFGRIDFEEALQDFTAGLMEADEFNDIMTLAKEIYDKNQQQ